MSRPTLCILAVLSVVLGCAACFAEVLPPPTPPMPSEFRPEAHYYVSGANVYRYRMTATPGKPFVRNGVVVRYNSGVLEERFQDCSSGNSCSPAWRPLSQRSTRPRLFRRW